MEGGEEEEKEGAKPQKTVVKLEARRRLHKEDTQ